MSLRILSFQQHGQTLQIFFMFLTGNGESKATLRFTFMEELDFQHVPQQFLEDFPCRLSFWTACCRCMWLGFAWHPVLVALPNTCSSTPLLLMGDFTTLLLERLCNQACWPWSWFYRDRHEWGWTRVFLWGVCPDPCIRQDDIMRRKPAWAIPPGPLSNLLTSVSYLSIGRTVIRLIVIFDAFSLYLIILSVFGKIICWH